LRCQFGGVFGCRLDSGGAVEAAGQELQRDEADDLGDLLVAVAVRAPTAARYSSSSPIAPEPSSWRRWRGTAPPSTQPPAPSRADTAPRSFSLFDRVAVEARAGATYLTPGG